MEEAKNEKELSFDNKRRILLQTKSHILRMPNNKKRVELLKGYAHLLYYYHTIQGKEEDDEEYNNQFDIDGEFTTKYYQYIYNDTVRAVNELEQNAPKLCEKYQQIIDIYKENEFCKYEYIKYIKVNANKMEEALWNFFASLGDDVLSVYCKMLLGENIYLNDRPMERLGYTYNANPIDNCCVEIQNIPYYLDFYTTLAHEVGHCYEHYLQKNQTTYSKFNPYCEITSMLFDKLFVEYLKSNHLIKDYPSINLENHIGDLNNLSISKTICNLFVTKKMKMIDPFSLEYNFDGTEDDLKKSIIDDCGYIEPFNFKAELIEINYSFGNIISRYFMEKLKNDFNTEWKNFKNFICANHYLPMNEIIDTYFDVDLVKDDIKKLIKSYRER